MATVGLAPPPDGTKAGQVWNAQMTIKQHGRTPLSKATPSLTIRNAATGETRKFAARRTGTVGVYAARVVFPSGGTWRYVVYDGFTTENSGMKVPCAQTHTFAPVSIVGGGGDDGFSLTSTWPFAGGVALALAALLGFFALRSRRAATPATR